MGCRVVRAVLWDMDGTILDSLPAIHAAANAALARQSMPPVGLATLRPWVGTPIREIFAALGARRDALDSMVAQYRMAYGTEATRAFPGMAEVLQALSRAGVRQAIVTTKNERLARRILGEHGLADLFQAVVGENGTRPLKPHPQSLFDACSELHVVADQAVMVGDTSHDLAAALAAGIRFIGVSWGYGDVETMRRPGIEVAESPRSLQTILASRFPVRA